MKKRTIFVIIFFILITVGLLAIGSRPAAAQDPAPTPSDNEVNRVAKEMYCPVCENIPLDVCPTTACQEWRELIRQKLAEGWTDEQIKDYFAEYYGDRVLAEPPASGLNWLVYILPWAAFLAGAFLVARVLISMRRKAAAPMGEVETPAAEMDGDPYMNQLEEALREKESK